MSQKLRSLRVVGFWASGLVIVALALAQYLRSQHLGSELDSSLATVSAPPLSQSRTTILEGATHVAPTLAFSSFVNEDYPVGMWVWVGSAGQPIWLEPNGRGIAYVGPVPVGAELRIDVRAGFLEFAGDRDIPVRPSQAAQLFHASAAHILSPPSRPTSRPKGGVMLVLSEDGWPVPGARLRRGSDTMTCSVHGVALVKSPRELGRFDSVSGPGEGGWLPRTLIRSEAWAAATRVHELVRAPVGADVHLPPHTGDSALLRVLPAADTSRVGSVKLDPTKRQVRVSALRSGRRYIVWCETGSTASVPLQLEFKDGAGDVRIGELVATSLDVGLPAFARRGERRPKLVAYKRWFASVGIPMRVSTARDARLFETGSRLEAPGLPYRGVASDDGRSVRFAGIPPGYYDLVDVNGVIDALRGVRVGSSASEATVAVRGKQLAPASGVLRVEIREFKRLEGMQVHILSEYHRYETVGVQGDDSASLEDLPSGVYSVRVSAQGQSSTQRKWVTLWTNCYVHGAAETVLELEPGK